MYRGPARPSKAPSTTRCQKCMKFGHYSYECKESVTERPYVSRPSRTQQLMNPKLVPELAQEVPEDLAKKTGVADKILRTKEDDREKSKHKTKTARRSRDVSEDRHRNRSRSSSFSRSISPPRKAQSRRRSSHDHQSQKRKHPSDDSTKGRNTEARPLHTVVSHQYRENNQEYVGKTDSRRSGNEYGREERNQQYRRSRSPVQRPRERSMSPYSMRLALTRGIADSR